MSRQVIGSNDGRFTVGHPSKLTDLPSTGAGFTACVWLKRLGDTSGGGTRGSVYSKLNSAGNTGWEIRINNSTASPALAIVYAEARATTAKVRTSNANPISNNNWYFLAFTVAAGTTASDVHIYIGSPGGALAEVSYNSSTNGSGAYNTDSALDLTIGWRGNGIGTDTWFNGLVCEWQMFGNQVMTLAQLQGVMNGTKVAQTFYCPMFGSASPEPDLSASASNVTISNGGTAGHAPVSVPNRLR